MLWALQKVFFGKLNPKWEGPWDPTHTKYKTDDLKAVELAAFIPLAIVVIFLGFQPGYIIGMMSTSVNELISAVSLYLTLLK